MSVWAYAQSCYTQFVPESGKGSLANHSEDCTSGGRVTGTRSVGGWLEPNVSPETVDGQNKFSVSRELNPRL